MGAFGGRQVVSSAWVSAATTNQSEAPVPASRGDGYGFMWWVRSVGDAPAYAAQGYGGQIIEVVPNLRLVVVTTMELEDEDDPHHRFGEDLMLSLAESFIAPAVRGET